VGGRDAMMAAGPACRRRARGDRRDVSHTGQLDSINGVLIESRSAKSGRNSAFANPPGGGRAAGTLSSCHWRRPGAVIRWRRRRLLRCCGCVRVPGCRGQEDHTAPNLHGLVAERQLYRLAGVENALTG
jgi:hypothetical protein